MEREREKDWYMHILSGKSKCIDRSTSRESERERERERERGVLFEFRHFFNSENSSAYFKVSCISLQKNLIDEMSLICADVEHAKAFWFSEGAIHR